MLLAVLVGAALVIAHNARGKPGARFRLGSGAEVRILGTTFGTRHLRPGWRRMVPLPFRAVVSHLLGDKPPGPGSVSTAAPALVIWLAHDNTNPAAPAEPVALVLAEDSGALGGEPASFTVFGGNPAVGTVSFTVLPRRSPTFRLLAFEMTPSGRHRRVAGLVVPNPARDAFPEWPAKPLPQSQTNAGVVCTLKAVKTGFGISTTTSYGEGGTAKITHSRAEDDAQNVAELTVEFGDLLTPTNQWEIAAIHVADATGNCLTNSSLGSSRVAGVTERTFTFGPTPWPSETWRLELLASRRGEAAFAASELASFTNVPLPAIGATGPINQGVQVGKTAITIHSLVRRAPLPENASSWRSGDLSELTLSVAGLPGDARFTLVSATDDQGQSLDSPSSSWGNSEPHSASYSFSRISRRARTLNLLFAVQRLRQFTFFVRAAPAAAEDLIPSRPIPE